MTRVAVHGVHLNIEIQGTGPALLLLHGFTGSSATWTPHLTTWKGWTTIAVDLLGHGHSDCPADANRYRMEYCVDDLIALQEHLGIRQAAVLGYSMGGRVAMHLALHAPERLWGLILESASPGILDEAERAARVQSDTMLAASIERNGLEAFVDHWQSLPLFATQSRLPETVRAALRHQRLTNNPQGLANSLRGMGTGMQKPVLQQLGELHIPVLLLVGALDTKYCMLARQMADVLPCHQLQIVPQAGHTVHLEQPGAFAHTVQEFLTACLQKSSTNG
jgi:2-succinyl-6-hydroxy-2,4-cyclohexadiene-1-carboxylate synthase